MLTPENHWSSVDIVLTPGHKICTLHFWYCETKCCIFNLSLSAGSYHIAYPPAGINLDYTDKLACTHTLLPAIVNYLQKNTACSRTLLPHLPLLLCPFLSPPVLALPLPTLLHLLHAFLQHLVCSISLLILFWLFVPFFHHYYFSLAYFSCWTNVTGHSSSKSISDLSKQWNLKSCLTPA